MENLVFTQLSIPEIRTMFREEIKAAMNEHKPEKQEWLKSSDVRKMLGISAGTLQTLRINGSLPFTKLNGTLYYSYDEVIAALNKNKRNTEK